MLNSMKINEIIEFFTGGEIVVGFVAFVVLSYLLISLFTWSLTKPFKYLSIPFVVVGILMILVRFSLPILIERLLINTMDIPSSIILPLLNPFLKAGMICIFVGILFRVLYIIINKLIKNTNTSEMVVVK